MINQEEIIKNNQKIIGFDLDDVLLAFNETINDWHNVQYGTDKKKEDFVSSGYANIWNCSEEEVAKRIFDFYISKEHLDSPVVEGSVEAIKELKADNNKLYIITAKPDTLREEMETWLDKNFPNMFDGIYFTNQFHGKGLKRTKSEFCKDLGVEIFIDDFLHNAKDISDSGIPVLLFDAPWNQVGLENELITRVYSWKEIVEKINEK